MAMSNTGKVNPFSKDKRMENTRKTMKRKEKKMLSVYADNGYLPTPRSVIILSLE
jgi:hypothetical protein